MVQTISAIRKKKRCMRIYGMKEKRGKLTGFVFWLFFYGWFANSIDSFIVQARPTFFDIKEGEIYFRNHSHSPSTSVGNLVVR